MNVPFFLYRRLARWITCEIRLSPNQILKLSDKYEVASFQDVFCNPFYWQVFKYLRSSQNLIIDCGAHCGHFSILVETCLQHKYSSLNIDSRYILVEPNPFLVKNLTKNMHDAQIKNFKILKGLLGKNSSGFGTLWINHTNYLSASLSPSQNTRPYQVPYINLHKEVLDRTVDILKIDIEGGEYEFIESHLDLLEKTQTLFIEIHPHPNYSLNHIFQSLEQAGLYQAEEAIQCSVNKLIVFKR